MQVHEFHKLTIWPDRAGTGGFGKIERFAGVACHQSKRFTGDMHALPLYSLEARLQVHTIFPYLERLSFVVSVARSSSVRGTSRSSISIAFAE